VNPDNKRELVNRLRSIQGHIKGIERMVEEDQYCIDILKQTDAVARALDRVNALLLGNHLDTCVTTAIRGDDQRERERVIGELMQVFQHSSKL
jgi:CsoR family transcriptional regulator, copper-sensing transcriptional repressor